MFFRKAIAFIKRDALESLSYRFNFFFQLLGTITSILPFFFVAKLIDGGPSATASLAPYGGTYFPFVLVGIAMASYQTTGLNSFADSIHREQEAGTLEAILITPTSLSSLILCGSLWSFIFASLRVLLYMLIGALLLGVDLSNVNLVSLGASILLTITALSGIGIFSAGFILVYKRGNPFNFLFNLGSKLLAGVYFPLAVLPGSLQLLAQCLPLTHALEALRKSMLLGASLSAIRQELFILLMFSVILVPAGLLFFQWTVRQVKRDGSLVFV